MTARKAVRPVENSALRAPTREGDREALGYHSADGALVMSVVNASAAVAPS